MDTGRSDCYELSSRADSLTGTHHLISDQLTWPRGGSVFPAHL